MRNQLTLDFIAMPSGNAYRTLLDFLARTTPTFSLVVRDQPSEPSMEEFLLRLGPYVLEVAAVESWPGTKLLFGDRAQLLKYRLTSEAAQLLAEATDALDGWRQPELPEDPCFYRESGDVMLTTIAHEHDAFFVVTPKEAHELEDMLPGLLVEAEPPE